MEYLLITSFGTDGQLLPLNVGTGDAIISYNGQPTSSNEALRAAVAGAKENAVSEAVVEIGRDGKIYKTKVSPTKPLGVNCHGGKGSEFEPAKENAELPKPGQPDQQQEIVHQGYGVASFIIMVLSVIGWLAVAGGVIFFFMSLGATGKYGESGLILVLPSFGVIIAGLITVASAQITRAMIDTANYTREMLMLQRGRA